MVLIFLAVAIDHSDIRGLITAGQWDLRKLKGLIFQSSYYMTELNEFLFLFAQCSPDVPFQPVSIHVNKVEKFLRINLIISGHFYLRK